MRSLIKASAGLALIFGSSQAAFAQKNRPQTPATEPSQSQPSFDDLLGQLRDQDREPAARPELDLPSVPEPWARPIFPNDDGEPRALPWDGLQASTAFLKIDDGVENTISKLRCADMVAGYRLDHIRQVTAAGDAISCGYVHDLGAPGRSSLSNPRVNVLMFKPAPDRTIEAQLADFQTSTEERLDDARRVPTEAQRVRFVDRELTCPSSSYALGSGANAQTMTTTICQAGYWRIRVRHIVKQDENVPQIDDFVSQFASNQAPAMALIDKCAAFIEGLSNQTPSGITGISFNAVALPYAERGDSCYAGSTSNAEGSVLVRYWPDNPDTPITVDFLSANGQYQATPTFRIQNMWANVPADEAGPAGYLLMREQADGRITTYRGYSRIPTDETAYNDSLAAYGGEIDAIFLSKQNDGGGWTMINK